MKGTCVVVVAALLHAGCAHPAPLETHPFPPDGTAIPLLPPVLTLPPWWPAGKPPPATEPLWMTYPPAWREAWLLKEKGSPFNSRPANERTFPQEDAALNA
jgi:hypothetical protein